MFKIMLGNVRHTLDEKDRFRIPAKYREALGGDSIILPGRMVYGEYVCLYVIPREKFERVFESTFQTDSLYADDDKQNAATTILGSADELVEDAQGRAKLNDDLRRAAHIGEDMVFVGKGDYLELWAGEIWDERYSILNKDNLNRVLETLKKHGV